MRLASVCYTEFAGTAQEWRLDGLALRDRNLLVGKNATGKSRTLNVIANLAKNLAGTGAVLPGPMRYRVRFDHDGKPLEYGFSSSEGSILEERLAIDGRILLDRGAKGEGRIFAERIDGGKEIDFQAPQEELAAVVRRDAIQHPFFQPLHDWGASVRHYDFGTPLGKDTFGIQAPNGLKLPEPDDKDASLVVAIFRRAMRELGEERFKRILLADLERMDYPADDVRAGATASIQLVPPMPGEVLILSVKERGLAGITEQQQMSRGMFRVLSLLILANYAMLSRRASCLLIDDIGEGLDFDRSCLLIDLLREKAEAGGLQLVAATNDKFVMDRVPMDEWTVLVREGSRLKALDAANSPDLFDEFRFTGLSNFSFLEMGFAEKQMAGSP
ncbi:MAG: ATP-binding protein [Gemmataceae bacterium]|nr:ATP-binding protein [Gemmataceae bacterium]